MAGLRMAADGLIVGRGRRGDIRRSGSRHGNYQDKGDILAVWRSVARWKSAENVPEFPYNPRMHDWSFDFLRRQIVGIDSAFDTPFGRRLMVYCDYTASGRCLIFVERYLQTLQRIYANTHTEDDLTGRSMSRLLHEAEAHDQARGERGPRAAGSSPAARAPPAPSTSCSRSSASTCRPATRKALGDELREFLGAEQFEAFVRFQQSHQPVVFVGPYEHHSNEVTWRQGLATVVEVNLAADGGVDLAHLEQLLEAARVPGPAAHRLVLGGVERHRHAHRRCRRSHDCCTRTAPTPASTTRRARRTSRST